MWRRGVRRALPRRDQWHHLQEYAVMESSQEEYRILRARDASVSAILDKAPAKAIDWAAWEERIGHKEVFESLKNFHGQQSVLLDSLLKEDHHAAVKGQTKGWELFDNAIKSCEKSVEKSEDILKNGARALWISFHNPPISQVSQSEWLDVDQYWQAFVEKHHFYHNHLASVVEDPESKEYDAKQITDLKQRWSTFDGKGTTRQNNKNLYQRPSFEYYDWLHGPLVEHMLYYLVKTGGDARFFPQFMPTQWYADIYDQKFKVLSVLQRRKAKAQESTLKRVMDLEYHPHDMEHDGESFYAKLIQNECAATELTMARLMGNYILFSDSHVPVQTGMAMQKALLMDGGKGTFFSLGGDVHCLFYKPAEALTMPDPSDCFYTFSDHVSMTGRRLHPAYATTLEVFVEVLETRKEGLGGAWLTTPDETTKEAFLRRLKKSDPASAIYEAYAEEHTEKWAQAQALSMDEAIDAMPEIERKYRLECTEYDNILFSFNDDLASASKLEQEQLSKLADVGRLQAEIDSGAFVAIEGDTVVTSADAVLASMVEFEGGRDKVVEGIMATKTARFK